MLAYAGLRWGELVALTVRRVDLLRRRLEIVEAITEVHGKVIVGTTKNHQRRSVPIPRFLADELAIQLAGKAPGDLVFTTPRAGCSATQTSGPGSGTRHRTRRAASADLHELRHTAASLAVAAGANVKAVQQMLGHASAAMTLDVYAGLFADDLDAVADQLDRAFARTTADQARSNRRPEQQRQAVLPSRAHLNMPLATDQDQVPSTAGTKIGSVNGRDQDQIPSTDGTKIRFGQRSTMVRTCADRWFVLERGPADHRSCGPSWCVETSLVIAAH